MWSGEHERLTVPSSRQVLQFIWSAISHTEMKKDSLCQCQKCGLTSGRLQYWRVDKYMYQCSVIVMLAVEPLHPVIKSAMLRKGTGTR